MLSFLRYLTIASILLLAPGAAQAYDTYAIVKVTTIEVTYMPSMVQFHVDGPIGSCPAGSWLVWATQGATQSARDQNNQAILAALMTAKASGQRVQLYVNNQGCKVEYMYII
jgi:hypothetical protein